MNRMKEELKKVRANPDYLPPICLGCGAEIGKPYVIAVLFGQPVYGSVDAYCYDEGDLLCHLCMDNELIEQWKKDGLWEEEDEPHGD
jgi:hypothetical protein